MAHSAGDAQAELVLLVCRCKSMAIGCANGGGAVDPGATAYDACFAWAGLSYGPIRGRSLVVTTVAVGNPLANVAQHVV